MLVLGVLSLSIPIPALMRCVTGTCPMACCAPRELAASASVESGTAAPKHCCAPKEDVSAYQSHSQGCQGCQCLTKSSAPVTLKKQDLAIADQTGLTVSLVPAIAPSLPAFLAFQVRIAGTDSGPPQEIADFHHSGRAPPALG
jgi:hypothetical protein